MSPTPAELRAWIDRTGYGLRPLARALGVDPSTITRWLGGERTPPPMLALALRWLEHERQEHTP